MKWTILIITIFPIMGISCFAQEASTQNGITSRPECEERALQIVKKLDPLSPLRNLVETGSKGDCVRYGWMDRMRNYGIKQASFLVEYRWKNKKVTFTFPSISYSELYFGEAIRDKNLLKEIVNSGLEQELKNVILSRLEKSDWATRKKGSVSRDKFETKIWDDESLPQVTLIF